MEPIVIVDHGGTPRLARSRINVYDVVHYLEGGHSVNLIALTLRITIAETEALIRYIEEHKEEVMAVHRQIEERNARGNPPEVEAILASSPKVAKIRARWEEIQRKRAQERNGESDPR